MNLYLASICKFAEEERTTFEIEGADKKDALEKARLYVLRGTAFHPFIYDTNDVKIEKKLNKKKYGLKTYDLKD